MSGSPVKRRYDNSTRSEQGRETRRRIVAAARAAFVDHGFAGTTMPMVAEAAGVSVETIYKAFGSKGGLARVVVDTAIAGDDEPVAMADRPAASEIAGAPDAVEMLRRYARHASGIYQRLGPLTTVLLAAHAGDDDLSRLKHESDDQRLQAASMLARALQRTGQLRPGLDEERVRDIIWAFNSPELHTLVIVDREWSSDDYQAVLTDGLAGLLLADPSPPSPCDEAPEP
jgi:AcrR family transcriptional regulator